MFLTPSRIEPPPPPDSVAVASPYILIPPKISLFYSGFVSPTVFNVHFSSQATGRFFSSLFAAVLFREIDPPSSRRPPQKTPAATFLQSPSLFPLVLTEETSGFSSYPFFPMMQFKRHARRLQISPKPRVLFLLLDPNVIQVLRLSMSTMIFQDPSLLSRPGLQSRPAPFCP